MPVLILRQPEIVRAGIRLAVPVLLAASLTVAARGQGFACECSNCPPLAQDNVLIGYLAELPESPAEVQTVEVLFDLVSESNSQEGYTLKVFELDEGVGFAPLLLQNPQPVLEQTFVVDNRSAGPAVTARWELLELQTPVSTGLGNPLIAIDTTPEQMQNGSVRLLFAEAASWQQARTYFSVDGGSCWCPLDDLELAYLLGDATLCGLDGSIFIKVNVNPN